MVSITVIIANTLYPIDGRAYHHQELSQILKQFTCTKDNVWHHMIEASCWRPSPKTFFGLVICETFQTTYLTLQTCAFQEHPPLPGCLIPLLHGSKDGWPHPLGPQGSEEEEGHEALPLPLLLRPPGALRCHRALAPGFRLHDASAPQSVEMAWWWRRWQRWAVCCCCCSSGGLGFTCGARQ